jgi:YnbE-like lipoprotein
MITMRFAMQRANSLTTAIGLVIGGILLATGGCTPRVEVMAPDKPITINLNVKIDHEIRVKVDKDLDKVLSEDSGLF